MKKRVLLIILLLLLPLSLSLVTSATMDSRNVLAEEFNISEDKIPTDVEDIRQLYLKLQWTEFIEKNKILSPINKFLITINPVFLILLAYPYELSFTFLGILILWIIAVYQTSKAVEKPGNIKGWQALLIGIAGVTVLLAQTRLLKLIVTFTLDLIFKQENWWMRTIILIVALGIIALEFKSFKMFSLSLEKRKTEKVKTEQAQQLKVAKSFTGSLRKLN